MAAGEQTARSRDDAHDAQDLLAAVIAHGSDAVCALDRGGVILTWNVAAARIFRTPAADAIGTHFRRFVPHDRAHEIDSLGRELAAGRPVRRHRTVRVRGDGERFLAEITLTRTNGADGHPRGYGVIVRELAELDSLQGDAIAAQLAALVQSSPDAIVAADLEGRLTLWNPGAERLYGWSAEDTLGRPFDLMIPAGAISRARIRFATTVAGEPSRRETEHVRADGSLVQLEVVLFPVHDRAGEVVGVSMLARDIAARREAQRVTARLAAVVDGVAEAIVGFDASGQVMSWNPGAQRLWGYSAEEAMGLRARDLVPERVREAADGLLPRAAAGERMELDTRVRCKDGRELTTQASICAIISSDSGVIQGYSVCVRDMTARRATERELERRAADLARMNADLETFAYAASHDLQEPLRVIRLAGELLSRLPEVRAGEESDMLVHQVMSSAERMSAQLDGLLEFVRAAPSGQPAAQTVSADLALDDALEALRLVIEESGATIERAPLPDVPVPRVQLAHVFQNLVANAVKFREPGCAPVLRIGAERAGAVWRITVEDDGIGIAPEHRERVFGVFARLHQDRQYPGTGIGLPLCRKIVERHGGTIAVAERPGPGTTFVLTLPAEVVA